MAQLPQPVPECHAVIAQLLERVKLLEERANLDANNSSKPPSSNGPGSMNRAQRRASQRKRGAQPGHKGHTRAMVDECDVDQLVNPCRCANAVVRSSWVMCRSATRSSNWVWTAVQPKLAVFSILPSRAQYVIQSIVGAVPHGAAMIRPLRRFASRKH
jgi:hypothetical protein